MAEQVVLRVAVAEMLAEAVAEMLAEALRNGYRGGSSE
jgi:hypothetical protein